MNFKKSIFAEKLIFHIHISIFLACEKTEFEGRCLYELIDSESATVVNSGGVEELPIKEHKLLAASRSGYYRWLQRKGKNPEIRRQKEAEMRVLNQKHKIIMFYLWYFSHMVSKLRFS